MNSAPSVVKAYLEKKAEILAPPIKGRPKCLRCRKPLVTCYCSDVAPISPPLKIVILMHPLEERHPVGTGRMAHQCLKNSEMMVGIDFQDHTRLAQLIDDPQYFPLLLFPGPQSVNLSQHEPAQQKTFVPDGKIPLVILLDGTWHLAKKILHMTRKLQILPRICFSLNKLSGFIVRKQPHPHCFSTIEAIHEVLELLSPEDYKATRAHDMLLQVFTAMVSKQLGYRALQRGRHNSGYHARKARRLRHREQKASAVARQAALK